MKVDGAALVLNRKRANNINFVSVFFFQNLVVIFGSFYTQISYFVANRFTFSPWSIAVRQEEPGSVVFSSLHILRKGISVVVQ